MSHEITANDKLFSVNEVPWHGLGNIIADAPAIPEAITLSGLDWDAFLSPMTVNIKVGGLPLAIEVPNQKAIIREDTGTVLGIVGDRYTIYQNSEMWKFIEDFQTISGIELETAGSIREGRMTWVLAKGGEFESLAGDPIEKYFLFSNSFDGKSPIRVMFTNVRVVCSNTLHMAFRGAGNTFNVRHTKSADGQIKQIQKALGLRVKNDVAMQNSLTAMTKKKMSDMDMINFIENSIFPAKGAIVQEVGENDEVLSKAEMSKRGETVRENKIEKVLELIEAGAGTNIKGVRGTAYGLYNALTEFADHHKQMRIGKRDEQEVKFENAFFASGNAFKQEVHAAITKELLAA